MSVYTVSLRDTSNLGQVNIGDGTLLANLSVAAGRGPKGDGWTGVTYDENTGTFIFTSNDGLAYTSPDVRPEVDLDNVDINSGTIDGTVIGGSTAAAGSFTTGSFTGIDVTGTVTADGLTVQGDISATGGDVDLDTLDLNAIAASKAVTAVDVFVYDTSNDTDGGKWRKRTQATSWYNETLNTATRGSRREFPSVAVIVAEDDTVTIYDGDDPALPMWMVFNETSGMWGSGAASATSCFALNGVLAVGLNGNQGMPVWNFLSDIQYKYDDSIDVREYGSISKRNTDNSANYSIYSTERLVDDTVNDVAMTVLPDAPIDPATGLPVPTIAAATAGGVSVIKDDGTVVDSALTSEAGSISFTDDNGLLFARHSAASASSLYLAASDVFTSDGWAATTIGGFSGVNGFPLLYVTVNDSLFSDGISQVAQIYGLSKILWNSTENQSLLNYTTSTYNTGWMNGDIKGAFLSDTDDTDLVGGDFAVNGGFDTNTDWTLTNATISGGEVSWTTNAFVSQISAITLKTGMVIRVGFDITSYASGYVYPYIAGKVQDGSQRGNIVGSYSFDVVIDEVVNQSIGIQSGNSPNHSVDNLTFEVLDADRSVNANPLTVNGTVTRSPVATGADLVAYSGFSSSNYLEQPYNSDLDFGTGDFSIMCWATASASSDWLMVRQTGGTTNTSGFWLYQSGGNSLSGDLIYRSYEGGSNTQVTVGTMTDKLQHFAVVRKSGVTSTYINGVLQNSVADTRNVSSTDAKLFVGCRADLSTAYTNGSLALLRISGTAPTAEQIAKIYEDEKFLFQENAQATLYGTSDAVTALAHDSDTDLLHVGTSDGRSVFQGLRRVENTTTAVGTAISANNGLVVEE